MTSVTPTEKDKEIRDILSEVLIDGQNQIHDLKDGKATPEEITERMFASLDYWQPKLMQLITADRKRVALEARLEELDYIRQKGQRIVVPGMEDRPVWSDAFRERLAGLKAQQEELGDS